MIKKIFVYISFCILLCCIAGCTQGTNLISNSTANPSTSTQSSDTAVLSSQRADEVSSDSGVGTTNNNCRLIVNGRDITSETYVRINYEYQNAELPIIAILKEFGAEVEWKDQTIVNITYKGYDFVLDTVKGTFTQVGDDLNAFEIPPGTKHAVSYRIGDEFVIDNNSSWDLIVNFMGAKIDIDYEAGVIEID
jgi:hypothetical protein